MVFSPFQEPNTQKSLHNTAEKYVTEMRKVVAGSHPHPANIGELFSEGSLNPYAEDPTRRGAVHPCTKSVVEPGIRKTWGKIMRLTSIRASMATTIRSKCRATAPNEAMPASFHLQTSISYI